VVDPRPAVDASSRIVLLLVLATGAMDAACLLHLDVFTAYVTASLIIAGANLVDHPGSPWPGLTAAGAFVIGAILAGWITRREGGRHELVARVLLVEAVVIAVGAIAAAVWGVHGDARYVVIALLGFAMGIQTDAIRFIHVPEIPLAAATLATVGFVVGITGEHGERKAMLRRVGVIAAILVGAIAGAALSRWEPWLAWAAIALLVATVALLARRWLAPPVESADVG
jgi:uncharacterized membrane protein YoaK (UPF0700 family)